jgi:hypothetical protein
VCVLIAWVPIKAQVEQKAGYTTLPNELKDLEQRDPYLGRIIRNPDGGVPSAGGFHRDHSSRQRGSRKSFTRSRGDEPQIFNWRC